MADRLKLLMKETQPAYTPGCPLLLEACALYQDGVTGQCIAQLKWRNLDPRPVMAVMIEVDGYDAFDQKLEPVNHQYDNLLAAQGSEFGSKAPVVIRNTKTIRFEAVVKAVSFGDEIWKNESGAPCQLLPAALGPALAGEQLAQYQRDLSKQGIAAAAAHQPQQTMGLWQCGCGSWQPEGIPCMKCRATMDALRKAADPALLATNLQAYNEEQERLRIEAERKAEEDRIAYAKAEAERKEREEAERKRREANRLAAEKKAAEDAAKRKKIGMIVAACILLAIAIGCAAKFHFIPNSQYNKAVQLMAEGKYAEASTAFSELGDYRDAAERVGEPYYVQAEAYLAQKDYDAASASFRTAGRYKDASRRVNEPYYIQAEELLAAGKYTEASNAFKAAGDYSDAADRVLEPYYVMAEDLLAQGKVDEASEVFGSLGNYRDAVSRRWEPYAQEAAALFNAGEYDSAAAAYLALYERSGYTYAEGWEKAKECYYQKALSLEAAGDQNAALAVYETILDYKDSTAKCASIHVSKGLAALESMDLATARSEFAAGGEHGDAKAQLALLDGYERAAALQRDGSYMEAQAEYAVLGDYLDAPAQVENCRAAEYDRAVKHLAEGKTAQAHASFTALGDYRDSAAQAAAISDTYAQAEGLLAQGDYDGAIALFASLNDYQDSWEKSKAAGYQKAEKLMAASSYDEAIATYEQLDGYGDSAQKLQDARYAKAEALLAAGDRKGSEAVYALIPDYAGVAEKLVALRTELGNEALANKDYAAALAYYLNVPQTDEIRALEYQLAQTCYDDGEYEYATRAYELLGQYELSVSKLPVARYAWANQLFENGEYAAAAEQFTILGNTTDSAQRAKESIYQLGMQQLNAKEYETAQETFGGIKGYSNANDMVLECDYRAARDLMEAGQYEEAKAKFAALKSYADSAEQRKECIYRQGMDAVNAGNLAEAEAHFAEILDYKDAQDQHKACIYRQAEALQAAGKYAEAEAGFAQLGDYQDATARTIVCIRAQADVLFGLGDYAGAEAIYARIMDVDDNANMYKECRLRQGKACISTKDYVGALTFVEGLNYADSDVLTGQCYDALGYAARVAGNVEEAVRLYSKAVAYPGVQATLYDIGKDYASTNQNRNAIETLWACGDYEPARAMLSELAGLLHANGQDATALVTYYALGDQKAAVPLAGDINIEQLTLELREYGIFTDGGFEKEMMYQHAKAVIDSNPGEAFDLFADIADYKDVASILRDNSSFDGVVAEKKAEADKLAKKGKFDEAQALYEVLALCGADVAEQVNMCHFWDFLAVPGRTMTFGRYSTDASGKTAPVKWIYLGVQNSQLIFISEQGLDYCTYDTYYEHTVKNWLNTAKNQLFSKEERRFVASLSMPNKALLNKYLPKESDRAFTPTPFAKKVKDSSSNKPYKYLGNGSYNDDGYWLSDKDGSNKHYTVAPSGEYEKYAKLDFHVNYVRPAIWVTMNLDSYLLLSGQTPNGSYKFFKNGKEETFVPEYSMPNEPAEPAATAAPATSKPAAPAFRVGTYESSAKGAIGDVTVILTIDEQGVITAAEIHAEDKTWPINGEAADQLAAQLLGKQLPVELDAVTGATFTSNAVIDAVEQIMEESKVEQPASSSVITEEPAVADGGVDYSGIFTAKGQGFFGEITVTLTLDASGTVTDVAIGAPKETPGFGDRAVDQMTEALLGNKVPVELDVVSGATYTSNGIIEALDMLMMELGIE